MADRTVSVRLLAIVGQYQGAMGQAVASTRQLESAVVSANRATTAANSRMVTSQRQAMSGFSSAMRQMKGMVLGIGLPLTIGAMVKSFLDFEQQMAHVAAVSGKLGRTADTMRMMRNAALESGQQFGFTAVEVGKAQEALIKAGRSTAQVLGGDLTAAMTLAAAGTVSLDMAADTIAVTMSQFSTEVAKGGLTATKVADQLSKAANATVSDVGGMATALKYVGPQAAGLGMSLEDTVTTLSLFNQAGLDADMAGTNMRGMLVSLMSPSKMAADEMDRLGLKLFDVKGAFIGMPALAGELNRLLGPESGKTAKEIQDTLGRLSTNAQIPGFTTLVLKGEEGWRKMAAAIKAEETASDVAQQKLNSLTGDLKKFGSTMNSAAIRTLEGATPALRGVVSGLTDMTKWFGNAGGAAQSAMLAMVAFMLLGRQRMPMFVQGLQGSGMNRALAAQAQATAAQARAAAQNAMLLARAQGPGARGPGGLLAVQNLKNQAAAAQNTANQYRGLSGIIGRTQGEISAASGGMAKTAAGLRGMGAAAGAAGAGLMGALGGPAGLAILGTFAAVAYVSGEMENAKRKVQDLADANVLLGDSYRQLGKMTGEVGKQFETGPLAELYEGPEGKPDIGLKKLGGYGFSRQQVAGAAAGTDLVARAAIRNRMRREIEESSRAFYASYGTERGGDTADLEANLKALESAWKRTDTIAKATAESENEAWRAAVKRYGGTVAGLSEADKAMAKGVSAIEAPGAKIGDILKAMADNVDTLKGSYLGASSAQAEFFGATMGAAESFAGKTPKGKEFQEKPRISFATKQFDVRDAQGIRQHAAAAKAVAAAFDMAKEAGTRAQAELPDAFKGVRAAAIIAASGVEEARAQFVKTYAPLVGGARAAERLADAYGLVTSRFAKQIGAEGVEKAAAGFQKLGARLSELPDGKVVISADTSDALRKIVGMKAGIETNPITGEVRYTFPSAASFAAAVAVAEQAVKPVTVPVVPKIAAGPKLAPAAGTLGPVHQKVTMNPDFGAFPKAPEQPVVVDPKVKPLPPFPDASVNVKPIMGPLYIPPQTVAVTPRLTSPVPRFLAPPPEKTPRWGAIHSFAGGGIHAMVGKGDLVRWAEPETGGEAYIPRKGDAGRSRSILDTAAGWYGLGVHKMALGGIHSFAEGGISQFNAPLGDFMSRYMGEPDTWTTRRTSAIIEQRDAIISVKDAEQSLREVRKDKKHTALDMAKAENALADARRHLATATSQAGKAKIPMRDQFKRAVDFGVKNTAQFMGNLNALASMGYGQLAMQLLQMGGPEAEAIAGGARHWPAAVLKRVAGQVAAGQQQQRTMENMPAMLAIRSMVAKGGSYGSLLGTGEFTGDQINSALNLMRAELKKTAAGRAMLAAMEGSTAAHLGAQIRGMAMGGIAGPGTMYRFAEPSTGGEAVIPRFGTGATAVLARAAAWHGQTLSSELGNRRATPARAVQVQISVVGEGTLGSMVEARVDGKLVQVAQAVSRGRSVRS